MNVALDTNRYVDLCKGVDETVTLVEEAERVLHARDRHFDHLPQLVRL